MEIEDFIPWYPSLDEDLGAFNGHVYAKKEFRNFDGGEHVLPQQQFVSRYMSMYTMYDGILVYHEMGSGKTCTAVNTVEAIISDPQSTIKRALVLVKGQSLVDNFINELITVCARDKYGHLLGNPRVRAKLRNTYEFSTYEVFAAHMAKNPREYDNRVIVIDEVHNLVTESKEEYNVLHKFLHTVKNCKVLLMSGTPMRDSPAEIADVMNLILPEDQQMPTGRSFDALFSQNRLTAESAGTLKNMFKGRVSYIRTPLSDVRRVFVGRSVGSLSGFKVFETQMSRFQTSTYTPLLKSERDLYLSARQASLFVFPDGSAGSAGFKKYMRKSESRSRTGEMKNRYAVADTAFAASIRDHDKLRAMSCKYAYLIEALESSPEQLFFVYCEFVEGSGLVLLSKILEAHGYSRSVGKDDAPGRRYAIITNLTTSLKQTRNILRAYNRSENRYGEYIRVILGSRMISEGFTLKNVQQVHILTPHWNYGETDQAIARAVRTFSHTALIADGITPVVKVYQHVSIPSTRAPSIDLQMYEVSEAKDIQMKQIERVVKESAVDCQIFKSQNAVTGYDGERPCEYQQCEYSCDIDAAASDDSTYSLYYPDTEITKLAQKLVNISDTLNVHDISPVVVSRTLDAVPTVTSKRGISGYPHIDGDLVYIGVNAYDNGDSGNMYYYTNPVFQATKPFADVVSKYLYTMRVPLLLNDLCDSPSPEIIAALPLEAQETVLELALGSPQKSLLRDTVLDHFKKYIHNVDSVVVSSLMYSTTKSMRCYANGQWTACPQHAVDAVLGESSDIEKRAAGFGCYGIIDRNKFRIKVVASGLVTDKRLAPRGRVCATIDKQELYNIAQRAGIVLDPTANKNVICSAIKNWFEANDLIVYL
jgi:superfamily II DNA or RNA helicase